MSIVLQPSVPMGPPVITEQPQPQYASRNTVVQLRVSTQGPNFANIQWYRNSEPVPGATSGSYMFAITDETVGYYAAIAFYSSSQMVTSHGVYVAMAPDVGGVAFSYSATVNGIVYLRVGHFKVETNGNIYGQYFTTSQTAVSVVNSGIKGYHANGGRDGVILKPVLQRKTFTGISSINANIIEVLFDGHTIVFARTVGTKVLRLQSINHAKSSIGVGYATISDPVLSDPVESDLNEGVFESQLGSYFHKRGVQDWSQLNVVMGAFKQPRRDDVSSGNFYNGNQYDSFLFKQESSASNVIYRHFGTDFQRCGVNNTDGHVHLMYGFGENGILMGFMGVEASRSHDGNYVSIFSYLRKFMNH